MASLHKMKLPTPQRVLWLQLVRGLMVVLLSMQGPSRGTLVAQFFLEPQIPLGPPSQLQ